MSKTYVLVFSLLEESDLCDISLLENNLETLKMIESIKINILLTSRELHSLVGNHLLTKKFNSKSTATATSITLFKDIEDAYDFKKYMVSLIRKDE